MKFTEIPYLVLKNFFLNNTSIIPDEYVPVPPTPTPPTILYSITSNIVGNGSLNQPLFLLVPSGGSRTYTYSPNTGYEIFDVLVDGVSVEITGTYTFETVVENHSFDVIFIETEGYMITSSVESGDGTIEPLGETIVEEGGDQSYILSPSGSSYVEHTRVDGEILNDDLQYYGESTGIIITSSVESGDGTIEPLGETVITSDTQEYIILSSSSSYVDSVSVDGEIVSDDLRYYTGIVYDNGGFN